jgi:eukaryotic-like serine/threonine-protein kinase
VIDVATRLCDRYRIESTLPAAGPSRAYRGVDERLDRPVMVLVPDRRPDDMALSQLDHPSLLRVYDADEAEGELFVVVEQVEGMTLAERLELGGPMSSDEAATLGRTLGAGLDHAHRLGVAGFELTEETVVITDHGPTVVDLGNGSGPEEDVADALDQLERTVQP